MRVKGGTVTHARRKRVLKRASGYFGSKHLLFKTAKEQVMHSLRYAYIDRRKLKRDYRKLWIRRINAACRLNDISYSKFMHGLKAANINVNRKMLSELAINEPQEFAKICELVKGGVEKHYADIQASQIKASQEAKTTELERKTRVAEARAARRAEK